MALVYLATNTANGKRYIGYATKTLRRRKSIHICASRERIPCMYISRAIKRYGAESFRFETLKDGLSKEEAESLEIELIAKLKPEYNLTSGGKGTSGLQWNARQREIIGLMHSEIVQRSVEKDRKPIICLDDVAVSVLCIAKQLSRSQSANLFYSSMEDASSRRRRDEGEHSGYRAGGFNSERWGPPVSFRDLTILADSG